MSTRWLVAKYSDDIRRGEPRNVGVIVLRDGTAVCRFLGEGTTTTGALDQRSLKRVQSIPTYKAWVKHWRRLLASSEITEATLTRLLSRHADSNYYLEQGGSLLVGEDSAPEDMVERLFKQLVSAPQAGETMRPEVPNVQALSETVLRRIDVWSRIKKNDPVDFADGRAHFDYRFDNSVPNLMNSVEVGKKRSWKVVEAAAYGFEKARSHMKQANRIALIAVREETDAREQLELLKTVAMIVDVQDVEAAARELSTVFHLQQ